MIIDDQLSAEVSDRIAMISLIAANRDAILGTYPLDVKALAQVAQDAEDAGCYAMAASVRRRLESYIPEDAEKIKSVGFHWRYVWKTRNGAETSRYMQVCKVVRKTSRTGVIVQFQDGRKERCDCRAIKLMEERQ